MVNYAKITERKIHMRLTNSILKSVEYYFISLSFYFSYGYFYMNKNKMYNGLISCAAF